MNFVEKILTFKGIDEGLVFNGPTSEMWFEPWKIYLEEQGVKFYTNTELKKIYYNDKNITAV